MKKNQVRLFTILFLTSIWRLSVCQTDFTLYLIGDAGENTSPGKTLQLLKSKIGNDPNSAIIFLGDNIYPRGLILKGNSDQADSSESKLLSQLNILRNYDGSAYFVPGNHDWGNGRVNGRKTLKNQEVYVEKFFKEEKIRGGFFPKNGLPGPIDTLIAPKIRLVFVDTQWWLFNVTPFHTVNTDNKSKRAVKNEFFNRMREILTKSNNNKETVVIAAHHPMFTNGKHAGKFQPIRFLNNNTPLQFIFGWIGLNRKLVQDVVQPKYKRMIKSFMEVTSGYENIIFAAGHDHALQYIVKDEIRYMVSGAGSKYSEIKVNPGVEETRYSSAGETGFFELKFSGNKLVNLNIINGENNAVLYHESEY